MKTFFSQTIGVAEPSPGTLIFHLMFLVSSHSVGGLACGAVPSCRGPRHWGQLSSAAACVRLTVMKNAESVVAAQRQNRFMYRLLLCVPHLVSNAGRDLSSTKASRSISRE